MVRVQEPCPVCGQSTLDVNAVRGRKLAHGEREADTVTGVSCANLCHTKPEWSQHTAEIQIIKTRH